MAAGVALTLCGWLVTDLAPKVEPEQRAEAIVAATEPLRSRITEQVAAAELAGRASHDVLDGIVHDLGGVAEATVHDRTVSIRFAQRAGPALADQTLVLQPVVERGRVLAWRCEGSLAPEHRPTLCSP